MITLKYGDKAIEVKITFKTANKFAKLECNKDTSLIDLISTKMAEFDGDFLVDLIQYFQINEPKLSKENVEDLLSDVFADEDSGYDLITLYCEVLDEFDVSGAFKRGLFKGLSNQMRTQMGEMVASLNEGNLNLPKANVNEKDTSQK